MYKPRPDGFAPASRPACHEEDMPILKLFAVLSIWFGICALFAWAIASP